MISAWEEVLDSPEFRDCMKTLVNEVSEDLTLYGNQPEYDVNGEGVYNDLTVAMNEAGEWGYQTGDNSFSGAAYFYPHWAVVSIYPALDDDEVDQVVHDIINQLGDLLSEIC